MEINPNRRERELNNPMAATTETWHVRSEDGVGSGRPVDLQRLTDEITDGVWGEADQTRGPGETRWTLIGDHSELGLLVPQTRGFTSKPAEEMEVDMTPMIDITFQLIIFFMITATFVVQKTLDVPQPKAEEESAPRRVGRSQLEEENIMVTILADGSITVDEQAASLDEISGMLEKAVAERETVELVLDVEDEVQYEIVIQVIDAAAGAEIEKIHFIRPAPPEGGSGPT